MLIICVCCTEVEGSRKGPGSQQLFKCHLIPGAKECRDPAKPRGKVSLTRAQDIPAALSIHYAANSDSLVKKVVIEYCRSSIVIHMLKQKYS